MSTIPKHILLGAVGSLIIGLIVIYTNAPSDREFAARQDSLSGLGVGAIPDTTGPTTNLTVVVHQATLNDLLESIGDLKGEGSLLFKSKLTNVEWNATEPHVQINDSGAILVATVNVRGIGLATQSVVQGNATVEYNIEKKQIEIVLQEVPFTLRLKVFGKRIKLFTLDIANLVGPRIGVLGNLPLYADFKVKKLEHRKPIRFNILRHVISYAPEQITIDFEVDFLERTEIDTIHGPPQSSVASDG